MSTIHITIAVPVPDGISAKREEVGARDLLAQVQASLEVIGGTATLGRRHAELEDVRAFHEKMMVPMSSAPALLDGAAQRYRHKFMQEELDEFADAHTAGDLCLAADALADLVYVAIGTALMMGVPWPAVWDAVQAANMTKRLAKPDGSDSKRGNPLDVVKPEDFVPPNHAAALGLQHEGALAMTFDATRAVADLAARRRAEAYDYEAGGGTAS